MNKLVLVACEFSGIVRDAFTEKGHFAMSCDFLGTERPGWHYKGDVRDVLEMALNDLGTKYPKRDAQIIKMRFGLNGTNKSKSLDEVGKKFGLSKERIRQIEAEILRRLRHPILRRRLDIYRGDK